MKVNFNMSRLIDLCMEADNAAADSEKSSKDYYKKHGHGVCLDKLKTPEERHIAYAYNEEVKTRDAVMSIIEVLNFDEEQCKRLWASCRAMTRWYEKETEWQRIPPQELIDRLSVFVIGEGA